MDTKKLRQKILDLAIRGKLVPQDPNDEPASVLLERIRAEKERLIAEGKIKRPKKSKASSAPSHYQNFTPPFEIPESWEWVRLEDICATITDGDHQAPPKANSGIPFLVISDIINGDISFKKARYVSKDYFSSIQEERKPKYGDILFTVTGSYGVPVKVETQKPFCFQRHIGLIRPLLIGEILYWWLQSAYIKGTCDKKATGTAQKTVSLSILRELRIPLPPKKEQERIVAEINEIQSLIEGISGSRKNISESIRKTKLKILDLAMQGKLVPQDPTDEPAGDMLMRINPKAKIITDTPHYQQLPDNWVLARIKDIFEINPKNKISDDLDAGFVPMASIHDGYSNKFQYEVKQWSKIKSGFTHFTDGDIAVAKISPCLENRKSMILRNLPNGIGAGTTELLVFRSQILIPEFSLLFFKSDIFIKRCTGTFNGVVGQQRVGKSIVEEILIPIPPLNMQKNIVRLINELFNNLDKILVNLSN